MGQQALAQSSTSHQILRAAAGPAERGVAFHTSAMCVSSDERGFPRARQIQRGNADACCVGNADAMRYLQNL